MDEYECVREAETLSDSTRGFVADNKPRGPWKTFVQDFGDDADVGICVGSDDKACVDIGDPELAQSSVQCRQDKGC